MKVNIYNETWEIKTVSQKVMKDLQNDQDQNYTYWGLCGTFDNVIYLLDELGPQRKRGALIHEVCHAINAISIQVGDEFNEEELCTFMATHFDEINKIVKTYFAPKKVTKREYKEKSLTVPKEVPKMSAPKTLSEVSE